MGDITQAKINQARETYLSVLDTLQDAYFEADARGYITFVNDAFCKHLGNINKAEVMGKHFRHFTDRNFVTVIFNSFKQVFQTKEPLPAFRYDYRRKDGETFFAEATVSPILDSENNVIGTRGVMRDITERVLADQALQQSREETEARAIELSAINRVSVLVNQSLNLNEILQTLCVELTELFPIRNAGIGLLTPDHKSLEIVAFHAIDRLEISALNMILPFEGNPSSQEVIKKKKTVVIQDAQKDSRTQSMADISKNRGTKAIMIVPLLARGQAIGTIGMPAKNPNHHFSENEIKLAETIASQIAAAIDNARLFAKTESALDLAERDLEIGRQIQGGFFPEKLPSPEGWEISAHFDAARQVAGDFYDIFPIAKTNLIAFVIADVCDKGVGAALFMVLFRSLLRAYSGIQFSENNVHAHLESVLINTNNYIANFHGRSNMFATVFFGILDPQNGLFYYINGGHEPPVILDETGQIKRRLLPSGPAVGMFADMDFQVKTVMLEEGDSLFGYTDGVTDAKNVVGQTFSEEKLLEILQAPWPSVLSALFEVNSHLKEHIGDHNQFDDITLLAFSRKAGNRHRLRRSAVLSNLEQIRSFVELAAQKSGLSQEHVFAFKLAVDEACTNIIQYGFENRSDGELVVTFEVDAGLARLTLTDNGTFFPPESAAAPDIEASLEDRKIGGLGIFFIQQLMDSVVYTQTKEQLNELVLEKKLT